MLKSVPFFVVVILTLGCGKQQAVKPAATPVAEETGKLDTAPARGLPPELVTILENADEMEVYSLAQPRRRKPGQPDPLEKKPKLHGEMVVGKTVVTDPAKRKEIAETIAIAIRMGQSNDDCFWPHHAVRVRKGTETIDIVICFHCNNAYVYRAKEERQLFSISDRYDYGRVLDVVLTKAGVPLEPPDE